MAIPTRFGNHLEFVAWFWRKNTSKVDTHFALRTIFHPTEKPSATEENWHGPDSWPEINDKDIIVDITTTKMATNIILFLNICCDYKYIDKITIWTHRVKSMIEQWVLRSTSFLLTVAYMYYKYCFCIFMNIDIEY